MKQITAEDRENLKTLMVDERWKAVSSIFEAWLETNKDACCLVKEDQRFYQGRASMIIDIMHYFEGIKRPERELAEGVVSGAHTTLLPHGYRRVAGSY